MLAIVLAVALQAAPAVGRYDMAVRLKALEMAWPKASVERRAAAIPKITNAVQSFFGANYGSACRSLDEATALVEGRQWLAEDAVTIRFTTPFVEDGAKAIAQAYWAYSVEAKPVTIKVHGVEKVLLPGEVVSLEVKSNPESHEAWTCYDAHIGAKKVRATFSVGKNVTKRIDSLSESESGYAKGVGLRLRELIAKPETMEAELPLSAWMQSAEEVLSKKGDLSVVSDFGYVRHKSSVMRAYVPKGSKGGVVVVAVHGAGGSENMFFEAYGRGRYVNEAAKRGWAFIAPRAGASAVADSLDWLESERKYKASKVFLMGHSMGGGVVVSAVRAGVKADAAALFAPATSPAALSQLNLPLFLSVGKQEMSMLRGPVENAAKSFPADRPFEFLQPDPSEHLMVVLDACDAAYRFLEKFAK